MMQVQALPKTSCRWEIKREIEIHTPKSIRPSITIVGLPKDYSKDEVVQMLVLQNGLIKDFSNSNDINDHIEIFAIQPLKNNPTCYQVFANVSKTLREGFTRLNNKITIGLKRCKVYDRFQEKIYFWF